MNLQSIKQRFAIIGSSNALDHALNTAIRVANTDLSVLVTGESGVGKEVFSKIIHQLSARKHNKFIPVNCGAIPEGTINSELFGHEKGAFTGATNDRKGYFETVDGGTIFLDEIGEMPLDTQAYLLRVLESGEFIRVGSSQVHKTDVRVIAATNVNLQERVRNGKFREDLYYRLNTVPISVPPLRERSKDILLLFRKFASDFAEKYRAAGIRLDERAQLLIENYRWPGNIRELKNMAEQVSVLSEERLVTASMLIEYFPHLTKRNLPALRRDDSEAETAFREREILYKLLFEMKSDLNDLKSLVFELIRNNNLEVSNTEQLQQMKPTALPFPSFPEESTSLPSPVESELSNNIDRTPIILDRQVNEQPLYDNSEVVEENLKLEDIEKEAIQRALKKHKGRRKDAAHELGISERTLYRKIKYYDL